MSNLSVPAGHPRDGAPSDPRERIDLIDPPASRPTWFALVYAAVFVIVATLLVQWPNIAQLLGIKPQF
jgi:hypothetical protein